MDNEEKNIFKIRRAESRIKRGVIISGISIALILVIIVLFIRTKIDEKFNTLINDVSILNIELQNCKLTFKPSKKDQTKLIFKGSDYDTTKAIGNHITSTKFTHNYESSKNTLNYKIISYSEYCTAKIYVPVSANFSSVNVKCNTNCFIVSTVDSF